MENVSLQWPPGLEDPSGTRAPKPRLSGRTMIIDKGMGLHAFEDMLHMAGDYIDIIKLGFGTAALYPAPVLRKKIRLCHAWGVEIMPGGTFLEAAVAQRDAARYLQTVADFGFGCIEVSDGTIDMPRSLRRSLIREALNCGLKVYTEYGKKKSGSTVDVSELLETVHDDVQWGASMVTVEGRESGAGVGLYDREGNCREEDVLKIVSQVEDPRLLMWETPQKSQQAYFIRTLGRDVNLGNIAPDSALALEALRRGLRSDTFVQESEGGDERTAKTGLPLVGETGAGR